MSENNSHGTHSFAPAAQKISQTSVPSGSGVRPIPPTRHNSGYGTLTEFSSGNDVAMNGMSAGEQNHQYQYTNAPSSTPRTAYPSSASNNASHPKWQSYHTIPYSNQNNGDHEHQRHIASPTVAPHGIQYSPTPSWDPTRPISRQQPSLQDSNYTHPHNMTNHSPYNNTPSYGRPPHHPVEPNAAPSPPNQYPSSPRTPQAIGTNQLPPTNSLAASSGLRQPASSIVPVAAAMSAPSLNGSHHLQEVQQERRDYQHNQRADHHHHRPSERNSFAEPVHDSKYSPLPQASRLINSGGGVRRLSGMDMRSGGGEHMPHQFGTPAPVNSQNYYSNSSPLSPGTKSVSMRNDSAHFNRGYQYNNTHNGSYRFDDKSAPDRAHSEENPYPPGLGSQLRRPSAMEVRKASPQGNANLPNGHPNLQEHAQNQRHDDTDDEDEIKREAVSRTASASVSPSTTRNVLPRARRDSIDSTGSAGSGREGSKKRGGPVFTDHNGKQYYEEDIVPAEIANEVPQGWQIGAGKKCLNKLLPLFKDGLPVFPEWGLTSAGKARQRLPKACASCRTKKIKCVESEQDDSKCQHCEKMRIACSQDEEEKPARKNSKKISEKKRKKDGTVDPDSGIGGSVSQGLLSLGGAQSVSASSKKRKTSDDGPKPGSFSKRGKSSRDSSFSMEPLDEKASGMDSSMDSSKSIVRHQQPKMQTTPVQREKRLTFATHEAIASVNVTDEGLASRSYNSRLLAEQYSYGNTGKHAPSETPPNSYTSASPTTSVSMEHPVTYGVNSNPYETGSKNMSVTPTLTSTPPLISIPHPFGEDPRHSQLPNLDVLEHLVNVYFTYVYSQTYAFLHRQTFTETLYKQPPVLLFSLCAVAARFSDRFYKYEEEFAEPARKLIFENYDNYCVEVVQSMIHMGLHDFGSSKGDKAWMFCGMAVRMGSALNLNLENGQAKMIIKSPIAREVARRTYWSYYLMDRFNGYGVARPFLTQDHDCHVQLPCNQPSFRDGKSVITQHLLGPNPSKPLVGDMFMGAMAFLVRVVGIWGNILKQIHLSGFDKEKDREKEFNSLIENLENWRKTLPRGLEYSNENLAGQIKVGTAGAFVTMHVMWHTAMAYVHRYVRTMNSHKEIESSNSSAAMENIVQSIRKTFVHADAVLLIMSHVQQKRNEAQRMGDTEVIVNAPFLGQAISDACDISIIRAIELKGEPGGARDQKERVFIGLEWLKELRKYWKPLEGMYKKLRKNCRGLERSMSQPPSGRMSNVIPSPDSGNGSELLATYPMFQFPIDPATYDLQPGLDVVDQNLPVSASMNQQNWYGVPEHFYEVAFASSALSLYGIAEAEGGFPQLYLDPDSVHNMRSAMDGMVTSLAPTTDVAYQTEMQGHAILDPSPMPLMPQQSFEQMQGHHIDPQDLDDSDNDDDEDEKAHEENGSTSSSKRREKGKTSISTLYFHPSAVLDGKLADSSGSESSGPESRRPSEAVPKADTNPMDVLHLLVSADTLDTHYVSKAVGIKNPSDLGTGRAGAMVPGDQSLMGEVSADNSKDHSIHH